MCVFLLGTYQIGKKKLIVLHCINIRKGFFVLMSKMLNAYFYLNSYYKDNAKFFAISKSTVAK